MTGATSAFAHSAHAASPFAGADVCEEAGLQLPAGADRVFFDDDLWDFTDVIGLPVQMPLSARRLDFTTVASPDWRLVAKELVMAIGSCS